MKSILKDAGKGLKALVVIAALIAVLVATTKFMALPVELLITIVVCVTTYKVAVLKYTSTNGNCKNSKDCTKYDPKV